MTQGTQDLSHCATLVFKAPHLSTVMPRQIHCALGHSEPINHQLWADSNKIGDSNWCKTGPVLVIEWGGRERGGGILGGWWRLEIALNRNYFLLRWLLGGLVVGWQAGLGTWTIHHQPQIHPHVDKLILSHHKIGSIQFSVRATCLVWLRLLLA